jgi:transposase-like protein
MNHPVMPQVKAFEAKSRLVDASSYSPRESKMRRRKRRCRELKAKVALEGIRSELTLNEIAIKHDVLPAQVSQWKRRLIERAAEAFNGPPARNARRDQYYQKVEMAQQATIVEESWMMDILQGRLSAEVVANQLACALPSTDTQRLHLCVRNATARYRTRALAMLALKKGIRKATIWHFLRVGRHYVDYVARHYQTLGIPWFGSHRHPGLRKHELERYQEAVFAILHSPPSAHGINRTAVWNDLWVIWG